MLSRKACQGTLGPIGLCRPVPGRTADRSTGAQRARSAFSAARGWRILGRDTQRVRDSDGDVSNQPYRGQGKRNRGGDPRASPKDKVSGEVRAQTLDPIAPSVLVRAQSGRAGRAREIERRNRPALCFGLILYAKVLSAEDVMVAGERLVHLRQDCGNGNPQHALDGQRSCEGMQKLRTHGECREELKHRCIRLSRRAVVPLDSERPLPSKRLVCSSRLSQDGTCDLDMPPSIL